MSHLKVAVSHPDFEIEAMRTAFVEGLLDAWRSAMDAQGIEAEPPEIRQAENTVDVYIAYGDEVDCVRNAERAVATMMLSISYGVVMSNSQKTKPTLLAYGFAIERDVELEDMTPGVPAHQEEPRPAAEASSSQS